MKKVLIISVIVLIVSSIAFGISVAATGTRDGGFGISISGTAFLGSGSSFGTTAKAGEVKEYTFDNGVSDIDIVTTSAEAVIKVDETSDKVSVRYESETGGQLFSARVEGDKLVVREEGAFLLHLFTFTKHEAKLEITLPQKEYDEVEIVTASGDIEIEKLICRDFESVVTSGNSDYNIFAEEINITTTSGCVTATNCTDRTADEIKLDSVSGTHKISGFRCNEFKLNSVSGIITAEGVSGKGTADIVSGEIYIGYSEWNSDLKLNAVSGEIDITLPDDAGVTVDLEAVSGGVDVDLTSDGSGAATARLTGDSQSGILGCDNVHNVKVDLVSGEVNIHN